MNEDELTRLEEALEKDMTDVAEVELGEFVSNVEDVVAGLVEGEAALQEEIQAVMKRLGPEVNMLAELGAANMRIDWLEKRLHEQTRLMWVLVGALVNSKSKEPVSITGHYTMPGHVPVEQYTVTRKSDGVQWELDLNTLLSKLSK